MIVASLVGFLNAESLGRERYSRDVEYEDASLEFAASNDERKLKQLEVQLKHYNGGDFDMASIRGYGCNCFMNDFGMENISYGKPVNNFDSSCRAYQVQIFFSKSCFNVQSGMFEMRKRGAR